MIIDSCVNYASKDNVNVNHIQNNMDTNINYLY